MTRLGGSDCLIRGKGSDSLNGNAGNDEIDGGEDNDILTHPGDGAAPCSAAPAFDIMYAVDDTVDQIDCGSGTNELATVDALDVVQLRTNPRHVAVLDTGRPAASRAGVWAK